MHRLRGVVAVLVSLGLGLMATVAGAGEPEEEKLAAYLGRFHELGQFDGAALVARGGSVVLETGYGPASREFGIPNGPEVRYRLASISKTFTAVLVMQLVDEGRLSLDATLSELLPDYRPDTGSRVRLRHLLGHSSGIPDYFRAAGGWAAFAARMDFAPPDKSGFVTSLCSGDLEFEPGTKWAYSNCGYFLLGMIIENATGQTYDRVLRDRILAPAGMEHTGDEGADPQAVVDHMAGYYIRVPGGFQRQGYWNMATAFAAGSLYSTTGDLMRYDRALAGDGLLSEMTKEQMFTAGVGGFGLGWEVRERPIGPDEATRRIATHEGFLFGSHTRIYRVLEDGLLVVLLSNTGDAPLEEMAAGVFDLMYGRSPQPPKPSIAGELRRLLAADGAEAVAARYHELRASQPDHWNFGERELNRLGYELLRNGRAADAVAVFGLNAEAFPDSGNCLDSLGEALAAAGRTEDAVRAYARSLELDPGNRNAVQKLSELVPAL